MRSTLRWSASLAVALLLAGAPVSAQDRSGAWFGGGVGWGSADLTCDDCGSSDSRESSAVVYVNGGYTLNPRLLVGAEFNIWSKDFADADLGGTAAVKFYNLLGALTFYPTNGGLFLKGGAGVAFFDMDVKASGLSMTLDMGKGLGVIVGGGYDIPLGRVAITPAVNYWYANTGDLTFEGETLLSGLSHNVFAVTVGVRFP